MIETTDEIASIPSTPPGTRLTVLDNGLTVIIREDHSAPVVSVQAWCRAGSVNEGRWLGAGLSHVLEHMLFKGTTTRAAGRIDQEVQDAGGYMNAYTSFDRTVYWINVPDTGAKVAVDILCDIMQNASLPADEMEKEKQVIVREMDMNQDDPHRRSSRRLFETAFTVSPYRYTVIGYPDVFNQVQRDDVFAYYRENYSPNNVFFVVVGKFDSNAIETQIREAYSKSKSRPLPAVVLPSEPRQMAPRELIEEGVVEMAHFHWCWHIPGLRHADMPVLDVAALLLGSGRSSRLFQEVREKQGLAQSVDAWTYCPGHAGLFGVSGMAETANFEAARRAIMSEVGKMQRTQVSEAELRKAVKQFISATLSSRKTMQGQAQDLGGNWMAASDLNFSERYLAAVKLITPADIQRVAQRYMTPENSTFYALLPKGTAQVKTTAVEVVAESAVRKTVFPNGLVLLTREDHRLPFVDYRAVFKGGVLADTEDNSGLSLLLSKLLIRGTKSRTAEQIATEIESVGGGIDTYSGNNSFGITAEVMTEDFNTGLELVADVILNPVFPEEVLEIEKQMQIASIKAQRDQLLQSAGLSMRRALYGNQGYGLDIKGTEESVSKANVAQLFQMHRQLVVPNNCVLAIYGNIRTEKVIAEVERYFGQWTPVQKPFSMPPAAAPLDGVRRTLETRDKKQAVVLLGFQGVDIHHEDRFALELLQEACSDLGSRLFMRIREKLGLAYYVGAQNFLGLVPGHFAFYAGTAPDKTGQVEEEMLKEAELLVREGLTQEELTRSKAKIVGQKKIARQELGACAMSNSLDELYGLGYGNMDSEDAKFEAVTLDQVKEAARKYFVLDKRVTSIIKPDMKTLEDTTVNAVE